MAGTRALASGTTDEPVVYGVILDLDVADPALCAAIRDRVEATLRFAALATDQPSLAVATVDLAPGCHQAPDRGFDGDAYDVALRDAERAFPGRAVRAVVLYVNDVALPVPWNVAAGFRALRSAVERRGGLGPRVYAMTQPGAASSASFDVRLPWTYGEDETMWGGLAQRLATDLPFTSRSPLQVSAPVLDAALAAEVLFLKLCAIQGDARVPGCAGIGSPCSTAPAAVVADAAFPAIWAAPHGTVPTVTASVLFEACVAHCDRFLDRDEGLVRWLDLRACVTEPTP